MKIAICFSGGIRYPRLGLESIKHLFSSHEVKIFIHTWKVENKEEFLNTIFDPQTKDKDEILTDYIDFVKNNYPYESLLIENFDAKKKYFEEVFNSLTFSNYTRTDIGPISMHYSIYMSNQLKKSYEEVHSMKFDKVIRIRFDSDFQGKELDLEELDSDICIPSGHDWGEGVNDQFAIGTSSGIDVYSDIFNNYKNIQQSRYESEQILKHHLEFNNIIPKRFYFIININSGIDWRNQAFHSPMKVYRNLNYEKQIDFYNSLFADIRCNDIVFGKMQLYKKSSIAEWIDYFPKGQFYDWSYDIYEFNQSFFDNIVYDYMNLLEEESIKLSLEKTKNKFDVIFYDSDNDFWSIIKVIRNVHSFLKPGGVLIIKNITYEGFTIDDYYFVIREYYHDKFYNKLLQVELNSDQLIVLTANGDEQ